MKNLIIKYKELILYVFFGVLTTLVNLVCFELLNKAIGENLYLVSNAIAWIIAVIFAYAVNKFFVFSSRSLNPKLLLREFSEFLGARVFSFLVEEAGLWLLVDVCKMSKISLRIIFFTLSGYLIAKIILAVIVIIMNYFFSKFIIFKKKEEKQEL